jgi:hypothetical protein
MDINHLRKANIMSDKAPVNTPTLATVIAQAITSMMGAVHTCMPGQIETYDYKTAKADVLPLINRSYDDGSVIRMPVIMNVPIVWPRTSAGAITFPLQRGDGVLILFSERSIDEWLTNGKQVTPLDTRQYDLSDAIAIPGCFAFNVSVPSPANGTDFIINYKGQTVSIKPDGTIEHGASATQYVMTAAYKSQLETYLGLIKTCLDSIGTASNPLQIIAAGAAFTVAYNIAFPSGFNPPNGLTTKVKAQ